MTPMSDIAILSEVPRQLRLSAVALVLANLVPLAGVVLWEWSVSSIVILYWFENVVIGVINVLRMITASPSSFDLVELASGSAGGDGTKRAALEDALGRMNSAAIRHGLKLFVIPFFIVHYFGFCAGHGVFVFSMFGDGDGFFDDSPGMNPFGAIGRAISIFYTPLALAAAALALSHAFSFVQNFLIGAEYRRMNVRQLMVMPYGRIIVLHITIIFGGIATMALGEPLWVLVILVAVKTAVDLRLHLAEHTSRPHGAASKIPNAAPGPRATRRDGSLPRKPPAPPLVDSPSCEQCPAFRVYRDLCYDDPSRGHDHEHSDQVFCEWHLFPTVDRL